MQNIGLIYPEEHPNGITVEEYKYIKNNTKETPAEPTEPEVAEPAQAKPVKKTAKKTKAE